MNRAIVNLLVLFWGGPLILRQLLSPLLSFIFKKSNNAKCREYISAIKATCKEKGIDFSNSLNKDIINSFVIFGASPQEYFLFDFQNRSLKERDEFITDAYRTQLQKKYIGLSLFKRDLINKWNFYKLNKDFFGRESFLLSKNTEFDDFLQFVKSQGEVFVKDNTGSFGHKASVVKYTTVEALYTVYKELTAGGDSEWIIEKLLKQDERMAVWNESSINTLRIPSYLMTDGTNIILRPFIRTGRKGAVVDNAGAGGIFAVVDEKSGIIITDGADEHFNKYIEHPDSRISYKGWQIPMWDELLMIVSKAHAQMPDHKYIAYDFALTSDGWLMIEGNWGQYICQQTATQTGVKRRFIELLTSK